MKTHIPVLILLALLNFAMLSQAAEPALAISIAVPSVDPGVERAIVANDIHSHFPVILTNTSDQPQRIATDWNSWGDHALSFEVTDESGNKSVARRTPVAYWKNVLHWWILQPGESMVMEVYFADPNKWQGFPHPASFGKPQTATLPAIFEFEPQKTTSGDPLWSGRITSKPGKYVFDNRMP